jgi:ATP-dependent RNA helicase RhlE
VEGVTHVIQHDMPDTPEAYVHRIGRTARAGASGIAIGLCSPDEREKLWQVQKLIRQEIPAEDMRQDRNQSMERPAQGQRSAAPKARSGPPGRGRGGPSRPAQGAPSRSGQGAAPSRGHAPRGGEARPKGGDAPLRRPSPEGARASAEGGRKDRAWRDSDFRDGGSAPAFLRGR